MKILKKILLVVFLIITILFFLFKIPSKWSKGSKTNLWKIERIKEIWFYLKLQKTKEIVKIWLNKVADFISHKLVSDSVTETKIHVVDRV
jgi:hypothetical protein